MKEEKDKKEQNQLVAALAECTPEEKRARRTPGLRAFDVLLYPIFTNVGVFGISVLATYLTNRGGDRHPVTGKLKFGKIGEWFHHRGEGVVKLFKAAGMSEDQADMAKMVAFSFIDGSLIAPFVKVVEDKREQIAYKLDKKWGTIPKDISVYDAEPEQSWTSVIAGRLVTCLIVVPTAVALDKTGLNKVLFKDPGLKFGRFIASKPSIAKHFRGWDIPELTKVSAFEAFYTSVCTGGLYFFSRALAGLSPRKHKLNLKEMGENGNGNGRHINPALVDLQAETAKNGRDENGTDEKNSHHAQLEATAARIESPTGWKKSRAKPPEGHFADMAQHETVIERG